MPEILLEIYTEEIPARFQNEQIYSRIGRIFEEELEKYNLKSANFELLTSPLRTVFIANLPHTVTTPKELVRGPRITAPDSAIKGFLSKYKVKETDLVEKEGYLWHEIPSQNIATAELIPTLIKQCFEKWQTLWPVTMTWNNSSFAWIRPIRNILCIFDGHSVDTEIAGCRSKDTVIGHKFSKFTRSNPIINSEEYKKFIDSQGIILDSYSPLQVQSRIAAINKALTSAILGLQNPQLDKNINSKSLDIITEVAGLCEVIDIIIGKIDAEFMILPEDIIIAVMKNHQRYIPIFNNNGRLSEYFAIIVDKKLTSDSKASILSGNMSVLVARLKDALFFYNTDLKTSTDTLQEALKKVVFHPKCGSVFDRINRIKNTYNKLFGFNAKADIIITHMKLDLCSQMVGEFPELQGYMAYHYYQKLWNTDPELENLANAILYQYKNFNDTLTHEWQKIVVSEWLEYCFSMLLCGEVPTSSRDPLGIRRRIKNTARWARENDISLDTLNGILDYFHGEFFTESQYLRQAKDIITDIFN